MNKRQVIANLKPNSVITLFHGSDEQTIYGMCLNGIDARQYWPRRHVHQVNVAGTSTRTMRGLFVSWSQKRSHRYGQTICKFRTLAKNVIHIYPSLDQIRDARKLYKEMYKSFRPEVSYNFLTEHEEQGLFVGLVCPESIEKVWTRDLNGLTSFCRTEFLDRFEYKYHWLDNQLLTVKDYKAANYDLLAKRAEYYQVNLNLDRLYAASSFEQQIYALEPYASYSVAKRIVLDMVHMGMLQKRPSFGTKRYNTFDLNDIYMKICISINSDKDHARTMKQTGRWGTKAAGCLVYCAGTDRYLVGLRSSQVTEPGTWGTFGGAIDDGETASRAALREFREECGYDGLVSSIEQLYVFEQKGFTYTTFLAVVDWEFEPVLNWESDGADWFSMSQLKRLSLQPGLREVLNSRSAKNVFLKLRRDPLGIEG